MDFLADSAPKKQTFLSMLISAVNRPMFALSILIHVGLMCIPLPESAEPAAAEEEKAETESLGDLAEINLAAAPLVEAPPLPVPTLEATPTPVVTIAPTIAADLSRAPRPPKKIEATPEVRSIPVPKPVFVATPTPVATPSPVVKSPSSQTPVQGGSSTTSTTTSAPPPPPPVATPAPTAAPPAPVPEIGIADPNSGISVDDLRNQLAGFRATLPESESDVVFPNLLAQPGSFFKAPVVGQNRASNTDCLETIVYCWWQPRESPRAVLPKIQEQKAFANLTFQEVSGGYGGGKLYNLVNKNTGQPTTLYISLPGAKGATGTGTLVVFWVSTPNP